MNVAGPRRDMRLPKPGCSPLLVDIQPLVPIPVIRTHNNRRKLNRRVRMRKNEVACTELEMDRQTGDRVLLRNVIGDPIHITWMLLEGEFHEVADLRIVNRYINSLLLSLYQAELALARFDRARRVSDAPVTLGVVEARIDRIGRKSTNPKVMRLDYAVA